MPICPKCGSPRIDRFCAFCGTASTQINDRRQQASVPPPVPVRASPKKPKQSTVPVAMLAMLIVGGMLWFMFMSFSRHVVPSAAVRAVPQMPVESGIARYIDQFNAEIGTRLILANASKVQFSTDPNLNQRLAEMKSQVDEVANLRERLAAALRQARLEDRWPVGVAGVKFYRPSQLQEAVDSADIFLRRAAAAEAELIRAAEQNGRAESEVSRITVEMQRIQTDLHLAATGQAPTDMTTLREKHAQFVELGAALNNAARGRTDVDWKVANVPPFQLK